MKDTILEVSQEFVNKLPKNLQDKIFRKEMPFNELFGDKLRIAEPLKGGLENSPLTQQIKNVLEYKYIIDFNNWSVYKSNDTSRKNPIRIGKAIAKEKAELTKNIEKINNLIELYNTDSNAFNERMKDKGWDIVSLKDQLKWNTTRLQTTDELLKTTNLEKQIKATAETGFYIIYSRVPIDVLRMSDFDTKSCHSEVDSGGGRGMYFYCALADAMLNAGVIYLVSKDEFENAGFLEDSKLQKNEIFEDSDRGVYGIRPIARMRLRRVFDKNGKELAVPKTAIYGKTNLRNDFINQVRDWVKKQNINNFDFENTLSLVGGSYEDSGHDIATEIRNTWGKNIRYTHNDESERQSREEVGELENYEEENYWEHIRDDLNNEENDNYEKLFESSDWSSESGLNIEINHNNGLMKLQFDIPDETINLIGKERFIKFSEDTKEINGWTIEKSINTFKLIFTKPNAVSIYDYGEYYDGVFSQEDYFDACNTIIIDEIKKFTGIIVTRYSNIPLVIRTAFVDEILKSFDIQPQTLDYNEIEEILENYSDEYKFTYVLPLDDLKINLDPKAFKRASNSLSGPIDNYWLLSNLDYNKLERYLTICSNHIFDKFYDASNFIFKQSSIETDEEYNTRISEINENVVKSVFDIFDIKTNLVIRNNNSNINFNFAKVLPVNLPPHISENLKNAENIMISNVYNEKYVLEIKITFNNNIDTIIDITDKNIGKYFYNVLDLLTDAEKDEDIDLFDFNGLDNKMKKYNGYSSLLLNKDMNQRELDLSSINRNMNNFDRYVSKLLQELNMAKGGIANQSGGTSPQQNTASGTQAPPSVSSNPSTKVNQPKTTGTNSSMGMNKTGNQQANPDEMDKMVLDKGTDFNNILQDPDNSTAVFQHISTSLADPNYKNRVALQGVLKNNQNFNKAYTDYIKQYKPLNTPQ